MSDFDVGRTVGKEIVSSFHFLTSRGPYKYLHTCGTQKAHRWFFQKSYQNAVPGVCLMCAYNVPNVCTYFFDKFILKYGIRAFQRRVACISTTKTHCCSSSWVFTSLIWKKTSLDSTNDRFSTTTIFMIGFEKKNAHPRHKIQAD